MDNVHTTIQKAESVNNITAMCFGHQGLFQDFTQEGAIALWQLSGGGANPRGNNNIKYREANCRGGGREGGSEILSNKCTVNPSTCAVVLAV